MTSGEIDLGMDTTGKTVEGIGPSIMSLAIAAKIIMQTIRMNNKFRMSGLGCLIFIETSPHILLAIPTLIAFPAKNARGYTNVNETLHLPT
jgi:Kef-type K+ transport system membrane component KefB